MSDSTLFKITPLKMGGYAAWEQDIKSYLLLKKWLRIILGEKAKPIVPARAHPALKDDALKAENELIAKQEDLLETWTDDNGTAAGAIALTLSIEEKRAVETHLMDGVALWAAIKKHHIV